MATEGSRIDFMFLAGLYPADGSATPPDLVSPGFAIGGLPVILSQFFLRKIWEKSERFSFPKNSNVTKNFKAATDFLCVH